MLQPTKARRKVQISSDSCKRVCVWVEDGCVTVCKITRCVCVCVCVMQTIFSNKFLPGRSHASRLPYTHTHTHTHRARTHTDRHTQPQTCIGKMRTHTHLQQLAIGRFACIPVSSVCIRLGHLLTRQHAVSHKARLAKPCTQQRSALLYVLCRADIGRTGAFMDLRSIVASDSQINWGDITLYYRCACVCV